MHGACRSRSSGKDVARSSNQEDGGAGEMSETAGRTIRVGRWSCYIQAVISSSQRGRLFRPG
jgi:hypothetical protein